MKRRAQKKLLALLLFGGLDLGCMKALPAEESGLPIDAPIEYYNEDGIALRGYDPVAFFKEKQAMLGLLLYYVDYKGAIFYFSSKDNKEAFEEEPERYLPQYGGFCAFGVANGYKAASNPAAFSIVNEKLYLHSSREARAEWSLNRERLIERADQNWPGVSFLTEVIK